MSKHRDPLGLSPHWHVDCRLEGELPEDKVVGRRFLLNTLVGASAVGMALFTGWLVYLSLNLRYQIRDWEHRIADNHGEARDIVRMQREYTAESNKLDQAAAIIKTPLSISGLIADLGRTLPARMQIDSIEWNDSGIVVRGSLRESSERGYPLLGGYVERLRRDARIGPVFKDIVLTDVQPSRTEEQLNFELSFHFRATPP